MNYTFRVARGFFQRLRGLMFRGSEYLGSYEVLMIPSCPCIHTFFVKEAIDIAFIDATGRVIDSVMGLRPRRLLYCRGAWAVLERFSGEGPQDPKDLERLRWFAPGDIVHLYGASVLLRV